MKKKEGCFPGEGNVRGVDDVVMESPVNQRSKEQGKKACVISPKALSGEGASTPGEERVLLTRQLHIMRGRFEDQCFHLGTAWCAKP
jgi:hypothetical protein